METSCHGEVILFNYNAYDAIVPLQMAVGGVDA
jgi:hypothetical protein